MACYLQARLEANTLADKPKDSIMIYRLFSFLLIGILPVVSVSSKLAWSEVVPTEDVLLAELGTSNRLLIASFFNRSDVAPLLEKYGLSSEEAKSRIEAFSVSRNRLESPNPNIN